MPDDPTPPPRRRPRTSAGPKRTAEAPPAAPPPASPPPSRFDWRHVLSAIVGALLAGGLAITIGTGGGDTTTVAGVTIPHTSVVVQLGGLGHKTVTLPPEAQAVAQSQKADVVAGAPQQAEAKLEAEPQASRAPEVKAQNKAIAPAGQPVAPVSIPLATVREPGCRTLPVRNYSSRAGSPSLLIVLHQTISPDSGWSGVLGNVSWFNSSAAQASSNYIVSRSGGQCAYIVPESLKAWAQAGFNSVTPCSVEVTETGREGSYLVGAGFRKVTQIVRDCARRWHIPVRHGRVSGCRVIRSGVVEHGDLGSCGGGHVDDRPYSIANVIAAASKGSSGSSGAPRGLHKPRSAVERRECAALQFHRRKAHNAHTWKATSLSAATKEKRDLAKRHAYCPSPYR